MALPFVTATGRLTDAPQLRFTPAGQAVVNFGIACNDNFKNDAGQWETRASIYLNVAVWGKRAEALTDALTTGTTVRVEGKLEVKKYETRKLGSGKWSTETSVQVTASSVWVEPISAPSTPASTDPWTTTTDTPF